MYGKVHVGLQCDMLFRYINKSTATFICRPDQELRIQSSLQGRHREQNKTLEIFLIEISFLRNQVVMHTHHWNLKYTKKIPNKDRRQCKLYKSE